MNKTIKKYFYQLLIYGFGSGFDAIVGFLVLPLYASVFSVKEYGIFSILILISTLFQSCFYLGASSALNRSYFEYKDEDERKKVASTSLYITLIGAISQIMIGILFANEISILLFENPDYSIHILLILCASALAFISQLFYLVLRLLMKPYYVIIVSILTSGVFLGILFYLLNNLQLGILSPVIALTVSNGFSLVVLFVLCKKYFSFTPKYQEFKIQLLFGLPQILIGFSYYFIDWIDRYFINEYLSLSDVGIYSFGYKIGLLIHVGFVIPFTKIWVPIRSENLHSKNFKILNSKILTYFYLIGSIIVLFIILFLNEFLLIFSAGSDEYMKSKFVIPIIMFGHLFFGMINILDIGIFKSRKPMMSALALIIHIPINIILNIILVPKIGYYGAAISTLITYLSLAFSI
jgi:O-antigen/teichoic acid export membrane protein